MVQVLVRLMTWVAVRLEPLRVAREAARGRLGTSREDGQATAEYALVILAAAAVALVLIAWARSSGKLPAFFDRIIDQISGSAE